MANNTYRSTQEAMTAEELSQAQSAHYRLDDLIRWGMGKMTIAQKQRVLDLINTMVPKETNQ